MRITRLRPHEETPKMVRLSIQTSISVAREKRQSNDNLFTAKRDRLIRSAGVVEEAHAVAEAAWYRAMLAAWVWPDDCAWVWEPGQDVDMVNPKLKIFDGHFAENVPWDADSVPSLHIEVEAREYARGFHDYAHRDTLRAIRPKWNAKELRRLRGSIRARFKDGADVLSHFGRAAVAERVLIPNDHGPARFRRKPPGCNVFANGDDFGVRLLRHERYPQRYKVEVAGHVFNLKAKWRKPLPNPSWPETEPRLETLARCAELWIMPSFFVESETEGVFSIITLLDRDGAEEWPLAA
jgi:hypothetical protein